MSDPYDVIIIGGGAAGLSAALVLGRARRRVVVVDAGSPRNAGAAHVHGFLSRDGVDPADVLAAGRAEVAGYGVEIKHDTVTGAYAKDGGFAAELAGGDRLEAPRIMLAVGTTDTVPDVPGLREGWAVDVLHCPYCHGHEVAGRRLAVLATHQGSAHQARLVRQWSDDVTLLTNDTADVDDAERTALGRRGIRVVDGVVEAIDRDAGTMTGVRLAGGEHVAAEVIFVIPRMDPPGRLVESLGLEVAETPMGPAVRAEDNGRTSVEGVWAAGNCVDPSAQVVTAASDGTVAGMDLNGDMIDEECGV
jgi:thioredoxin reductase